MTATWYFDFISPYAYLQLPRILELRASLDVVPKPILFGALLERYGQLGPAEIPGKREFTYRIVQWTAERAGIPLRFPAAHPFNPLAALRLCVAAGASWESVRAIYAHLWGEGGAPDDLGDVAKTLGITDFAAATSADAVKATLRANTEEALARGVYGVPTLAIGDELFWGNDATGMIEEYLADPARFDTPEYRRIAALPIGLSRKR